MASVMSDSNKSLGWTESNSATDLESSSNQSSSSHAKLSLIAAAVFIVGEMAGSGVLALPKAVAGTGWTGVFLIALSAAAAAQAAIYLGDCWLIIEERWPEYRSIQSDPYGVIGMKAFGRKTQLLVSLSVSIQLYGVAVVFLSLCSELVRELLHDSGIATSITTCHWIIVIGLISIPFMWLPTPAEISFVAYTAMSCTAISCAFVLGLFIQEGVRESKCSPPSPAITPRSFFLSLGTIAFAYGGAATFPTFQNYMKNKKQFPRAIVFGFILMLVLYLTIAVGGFLLYGGEVKPNVLENLPASVIKTLIGVLMAFHVFAAMLIVINPVNLSFEQTIRLTNVTGITWSKSLVRTGMCLSMIFVGLTIPKFDKILQLVGAATVSTTSFMFPPIFYLKLIRQSHASWPERKIGTVTWIVAPAITLFGLVGGVVATYSALEDIFSPDAFAKPCYA